MKTKVSKWGDSLALRIPKSFASEANVAEGATVNLTLRHGKIVIAPMRAARFTLSLLLEEVRPENLHGEISTGTPCGREAW